MRRFVMANTTISNKGHLLTTKDVAQALNVVDRYPLVLAKQGKLPCVRIAAKCVRFRAEDVQAFIDGCIDDGKGAK